MGDSGNFWVISYLTQNVNSLIGLLDLARDPVFGKRSLSLPHQLILGCSSLGLTCQWQRWQLVRGHEGTSVKPSGWGRGEESCAVERLDLVWSKPPSLPGRAGSTVTPPTAVPHSAAVPQRGARADAVLQSPHRFSHGIDKCSVRERLSAAA